jgi:hypothetical protein
MNKSDIDKEQTMSTAGSFESSGGMFPDGYCLWQLFIGTSPNLVACHCRESYVPGDGPLGVIPEFDGQVIKWSCELPPSSSDSPS